MLKNKKKTGIQGLQRIEIIKIANEFKLAVVQFSPRQVHVPDAHLRMDLPLNKKSVEVSRGPLGREMGPRAAGPGRRQ